MGAGAKKKPREALPRQAYEDLLATASPPVSPARQ
jgi:hypothetical protein